MISFIGLREYEKRLGAGIYVAGRCGTQSVEELRCDFGAGITENLWGSRILGLWSM